MGLLRRLSLPTVYWLFVAWLFAPLLVMAAMGLRDSNFVAFPIEKWTTRWYREIIFDRDILASLWVSVKVAVIATVISLVVGLPTAFVAAKTRGIWRGVTMAAILIPAFIPVIVSAIALRIFAGQIGLQTGPFAIALAHAVASVPFVVVMVLTRIDAMNRNLIDAARNLGADDLVILIRITLPYLAPALLGAFMFSMLLSFEDFVRSFFLGGFDQTFPVLLYSKLRFGFNPGLAAISVIVLAATIALGLLAERFVRSRRLRADAAQPGNAHD